MRGHLSPRENTCRTTNQRSGADRKQELFPLNVISDEAKHFFIVHQRLLPITAGHEQSIKESCFSYAHFRVNSKPLHIADRRYLLFQ